MKAARYIIQILAALFLLSIAIASSVHVPVNYSVAKKELILPPDTNPPDSLQFPFDDNSGNPYDAGQNGGLYMNNPSNVQTEVVYDPENNEYIIKNNVGTLEYRPSNYMSFDEYTNFDMDQALQQYWHDRNKANRGSKGDGNIIPKIHINNKVFDKIFGGTTIDIRPSGSAELIFGVISTKTNNPALDVKQRRTTNFDFQEKIQLNVTAKIG
ncbi:MAG: hypothetical protein WC401_03220, partial [Bacteroidales bacterium]